MLKISRSHLVYSFYFHPASSLYSSIAINMSLLTYHFIWGNRMQFRPPFRPSPSDQSWQPQGFPTQDQVYLQQQQQLYPPQFQPPPVMLSQPPEKKSRKRFLLVIATVVVVLALATALGSLIASISSTARPQIKAAPTQAEQPISQSTPASTSTTTAEKLQNIKPTHGSPSLGGQISDFIGTYGRPSMTDGKDSMWLLNSEGSLSLDVRDTGRGVVGYLSISTPGSWNLQKVQDYCLTFAPHNFTLNKTSNPDNSSGLYVYDSPSGKFSLHVSSGYPMYCYMNSISNP